MAFQFVRFCDVIGAPELGRDPRYVTNLGRIQNRDALIPALRALLAKHTKDEILSLLQSVKVPCGPIHTVAEALQSDQATARGTVVDVARQDVADEQVRLLANPLKFSKTPVRYDLPPPRFGQDTEAVLNMLKAATPQG